MLSFTPQTLLDLGINPLVILVFVLACVVVPLLVVKFAYSKKKYKCTECDKIFSPKFFQTHIGYVQDLSDDSKRGREQYCPHCHKITWCKFFEQ